MKGVEDDYRAWCAKGIERLEQRFPEIKELYSDERRAEAEEDGAASFAEFAAALNGILGPVEKDGASGADQPNDSAQVHATADSDPSGDPDQDPILKLLMAEGATEEPSDATPDARTVDLSGVTHVSPEFDFGE